MTGKDRVLIVEDEIVVALFMEDVVAELGYEVAGVVGHLDEAMTREPDYGMAVLDVHLNGRSVFDFADFCHRLWRAGHPRAAPRPAGAAEALPA
jgi:DNA-binding response OmpR family regulator